MGTGHGGLCGCEKLRFYELIDFSDFEGFMGPRTSSKLLQDFHECREQARRSGLDMETYDNFVRAFELGANDGAVEFH